MLKYEEKYFLCKIAMNKSKGSMEIIEVNSSKTIKEFHKVPFIVYKEDENWIPHLKQDIDGVFDPDKNKFFRHGKAIRWILRSNEGELLGRVAAFINEKYSRGFKQKTGGMGFFECLQNKDAAFLLLDTAKNWLEKNGMEAMDGPINFGEKDKYWGLITENFNMPPYYAQNYNPEYYLDFFKDYGFKVFYEQLIFYRKIHDPLQQDFIEKAKRIEENERYTFRFIKKDKIEKFAEDFRDVYNKAWGKRDGNEFKGMAKAQALSLFKSMKQVIDEDLICFAYYDNEPVGFYLSLPEINQIFKYVNGNLNWWGKLKFLYYKRKGVCTTSFGLAFGIAPDHQGKGLEGALFRELAHRLQPKQKYDDIIITWIGDFNPKMIKIIQKVGAKKIRKMATFRYLFDREAEFERYPVKS